MTEYKKNLLGYLLCTPEQENRVLCREVDENREIHDYTFSDLMKSSCNLGQFFNQEQEWGDCIPLFLDTSYRFLEVFFGLIAARKTSVPIHTTATEETIDFILRKIQAKCIIVTDPWLYKRLVSVDYVHEHIHTILTTEKIISQKALPSRHINIEPILKQSKDSAYIRQYLQEVFDQSKADDPMQIVFTSGTTGEPKGAVLSHKNVISCVEEAGNHLKIDSDYRTLTFLPLSHVMGQNEVFIALVKKAVIQIVNRDNLLYGLKELNPNILVSVPRVYQAIYQGIYRKLRTKPFAKKMIAFFVNLQSSSKRSSSWIKRIACKFLVKTIGYLLMSKVRQGLGKFRLLVTAGAACPTHLYDFFEAIGMPLTNAQGLTEVSGAIVYNNANETINGSVGFPLPSVDVKIAEDGEILFRGNPVFSGYYEEPDANKNSFTKDGWFRTGDLGRVEKIKNKKYLFLEGRKKEIVVLASGENIPPVQIEEKLIKHDIIHQAVIVGDGKPRLGALIVPNDGYYDNPNLREEISKVIRQVNAEMKATEKISNFEILPEPFTVENGMLTPTLKIRRPLVFRKYQHIIGQLYNTPA